MSLFGKKESGSPASQETVPAPAPAAAPAPAPMQVPPARPAAPSPVPETRPSAPVVPQRVSQTLLGATFSIKGDVSADENITIEGIVEGTITTTRDVVVASEGRVRADIRAATIIISGKVRGNVTATNKVDLQATGQLEGNIHSPKLAIAESALFKGSIDMSSPDSRPAKESTKK
jgi:cytoskeletal protein CcmA (bactofilin family)